MKGNPLMFYKSNNTGYQEILPGIQIKTLVYGDKTLMSEFHLAQGSQLPLHSHPQEQTGYLISGHMRLFVGEETFDLTPGDSWCVAGDVQHRAEIFVDSVAIEIFSPVREDYLPYFVKS
jgi:quercetin dioxygenase-like cupin family protein